ncbi:MAG: MerR family transcriptional regulator [Actinomycetota bacterium]|nr:MerR family transcriptional regulator [Actinomycetota bacterium]
MPGVAERLTIAEAAERSGVSAHALRYYERAGLLDPSRAGNGHRRYGERDLEWLRFLTKLRATGMPIRQIRAYAELYRQGDETHGDRLSLLEAHRDRVRERLAETERSLELIDHKITYYRERLRDR